MTCIIAKNDKYWYIPYVQYTVYTVYIVLLLKTRHILKLFPEILKLSSSVNSPKMRISFPLIFFIYCRAFDAYSSIELRRRCMQYCGSGSPNPHHFHPRIRIIFLEQDPYQSYSWIRTTVFKNHRDLDQTPKILKMS